LSATVSAGLYEDVSCPVLLPANPNLSIYTMHIYAHHFTH